MFISVLQASLPMVFGRPIFLLPGMSTSHTLFAMCSLFLLITRPYQFSHFSVIVLDACVTFGVLRFSYYWSFFVLSTSSSHSSLFCFLPFCCPGSCSVHHGCTENCFLDRQLHWQHPVTQYSTILFPISPRSNHSLLDLRLHASFLFHEIPYIYITSLSSVLLSGFPRSLAS